MKHDGLSQIGTAAPERAAPTLVTTDQLIGKDVARLADAAEAILALYRSEIERTRR